MANKEKGRERKQVDKKVLSFFLLAFPTLIIIILGMFIEPGKSWWVQVILALYQFILLRQFLDNYYETVV
jgi:hypothetical protein